MQETGASDEQAAALQVADPAPPGWGDGDRPIRKGREDIVGDPAWTRERAAVAGIGGFGALFAAGWAMSKVYKRKSGPL